MMIPALILIPVIAGIAAFLIRTEEVRRGLLVATAVLHAVLTGTAWVRPPAAVLNGWLELDALGLLFLSITSVLFLAAAVYGIGYLKREGPGQRPDLEEGDLFSNAPEAIFTGCMLLFLATMTVVTVSQHFGLLWVAIEATTLASAPLIYFHRHHRSLEATWKYLLICSVGIGLALLGNFFLAVASSVPGRETPMVVSDLIAEAAMINPAWLRAAFVLLLVGYGTKMGLAPLHTWKPDVYSESPSVVAALLAGALGNCAFLGILRMMQVCVAAGQGEFCQKLLVGFGLLSMAVAAIFILGQLDYKRMLAYSSVEHVGILALGVGLGGAGSYGAMLHALNHSLTKAMLFFLAGNILTLYRSRSTREISGVVRALPVSGVLWVAGFLAITGSPPFGPFMSELTILQAALVQGHAVVAGLYLALLAVVFIGMATIVLRMAQGVPADGVAVLRKESAPSVVPPVVLGALVLLLGLWIPPGLHGVLEAAAKLIGGP